MRKILSLIFITVIGISSSFAKELEGTNLQAVKTVLEANLGVNEFEELQDQLNFLNRIERKIASYGDGISEEAKLICKLVIAKQKETAIGMDKLKKEDVQKKTSKPEKDPKAIAAAKKMKASGYPACMLCKENIGYAGRMNHPARQNHRAIPITVNHADWFLQYSPYVYYNEHCIVFCGEHVPMQIDKSTFRKLFDFVEQFPHYFLGSNADLPIVGGSILTHDHYQGGHYTFAMARANMEEHCTLHGFEDVEAGILNWPVSVLRLRHKNPERLIDAADHVLKAWRSYTDEDAFIFAETDGEPHNTITPIARCVDGVYELDLALRNNITTEKYPLGVYHPHDEYHHIKKENIGLIEVMGLAVLPSRLKDELKTLKDVMLKNGDVSSVESIAKHAEWAAQVKRDHPEMNEANAEHILQQEVGKVFVKVLENAGVYKCTAEGRKAFRTFVESVR